MIHTADSRATAATPSETPYSFATTDAAAATMAAGIWWCRKLDEASAQSSVTIHMAASEQKKYLSNSTPACTAAAAAAAPANATVAATTATFASAAGNWRHCESDEHVAQSSVMIHMAANEAKQHRSNCGAEASSTPAAAAPAASAANADIVTTALASTTESWCHNKPVEDVPQSLAMMHKAGSEATNKHSALP